MTTRRTDLRYSASGTEDTTRKIDGIGAAGERTGKRVRKGAQEASAGLKAINAGSREARNAIENLAGGTGAIGRVLTSLGPAGLVAAGGIGAITLGLYKLVAAGSEVEKQMGAVAAVLRSTRGISGQTSDSINQLSRKLAIDTLGSVNEFRQANVQLLGYTKIWDDNFARTLTLAKDFSVSTQRALNSSLDLIAKALQNPEKGLIALDNAYDLVNESQAENIKLMAESGRLGEAQTEILNALQRAVGGAAAGQAVGLAGSTDTLSESWTAFLENMSESSGVMRPVIGTINTLSAAVKFLNDLVSADSLESEIEKIQRSLSHLKGAGAPNTQYYKDLQDRLKVLQTLVRYEKEQAAAEADAAKSQADQARANQRAEELADKIKGLKDAADPAGVALRTYNAQLENFRRGAKEGAITADQLTEAEKLLKQQYEAEVQKGLLPAQKAAEKLRETRAKQLSDLQLQADQETALTEAFKISDDAFDQKSTLIEIQSALITSDLIPANTTLAQLQNILASTTDDEITKRAKLIETIASEKHIREGLTDARKEEERAAEKEADQRQREQEQVQRLLEEPYLNAARNIQNTFTDVWEQIFTGGIHSFSDLAKQVWGIFARLAAELVTLQFFNPAALVGSAGGGAGGGGAGVLGTVGTGASLAGLTGINLGLGGFASGIGSSINAFGAAHLGTGVNAATLGSLGPNQLGSFSQVGATSLTGYLGAAGLGALGGSLITGLIGGNKTVGSIGGAGVGIALAASNPLLAAGIGLATIIGSLFGGKPSDKPQGAFFNPSTGAVTTHGATGKKFSQENLDAAKNAIAAVQSFVTQFSDLTGGHLALSPGANGLTQLGGSDWGVAGGQIGIKVGERDGIDVGVGAATAHFGVGQEDEASKWIIQQVLQSFEGLPDAVKTAVEHTDFSDIQAALGDVGFAAKFEDTITAFHKGATDFADVVELQVKQQVQDLVKQLQDFNAQTDRLGLSVSDAKDAEKDYISQLLGLTDGAAPLSAVQSEFIRLDTTLEGLKPLLSEVTIGFDDAAAAVGKTKQQIADTFSDQARRGALGIDDGVFGVLDAFNSAMKDAQFLAGQGLLDLTTVGGNLATTRDNQLAQLFSGQSSEQLKTIIAYFSTIEDGEPVIRAATKALNGLSDSAFALATSAVDDARNTLLDSYNREADELTRVRDRFQDFARTLGSFRTSLLLGDLSPLGPGAKVAEARRQFELLAGRALAGDEDALAELQGSSQTLLEASRSYFGSSEAFFADFSRVQDVLLEAQDLAQDQVSIDDMQLTAMHDQVSQLIELNDNVVAFTDAFARYQDALLNLNRAEPAPTQIFDDGPRPPASSRAQAGQVAAIAPAMAASVATTQEGFRQLVTLQQQLNKDTAEMRALLERATST